MSERGGSDIERLWNWISWSTQNRLKMASFRVVPCRIRIFPTLIAKIKWLESELVTFRTRNFRFGATIGLFHSVSDLLFLESVPYFVDISWPCTIISLMVFSASLLGNPISFFASVFDFKFTLSFVFANLSNGIKSGTGSDEPDFISSLRKS